MVIMFGYTPLYDLIGISVAHLYYYLEDVVPKIPETYDVKVLRPPRILITLCEATHIHEFNANEEDLAFEEEIVDNIEVNEGLAEENPPQDN